MRMPATGTLVLALFAALIGCERSTDGPPAETPAKARQALAQGARAMEQALLARLEANPHDLEARHTLANLYYDTDRPHRAVPNYLEVLEHRPDDPAVRTDLGTCYRNMGLLDQARVEYERVLKQHPGHIQATYNLAVVSKLAGDELRAAELWEHVAAIAPGTAVASAALRHAAEARRAASRPPTPETVTPTRRDSRP